MRGTPNRVFGAHALRARGTLAQRARARGVRTGASQSALEPIDKGLSALAEGELF